jgi:RTX calcium-binding nonapeptide repeat (4 copies)
MKKAVLTFLFSATVVLPVLQAPSVAATALCEGLPVTISSSARTINGTSRNDVIQVLGTGSHTVRAGAGNDVVCGSPGRDTINGDAGNDIIVAAAGNDTVNGGAGDDKIVGGEGNDNLQGTSGEDHILGSEGNDVVNGGTQVDTLSGGSGTDRLTTGGGANTCQSDAADTVSGTCTFDASVPTMTNMTFDSIITAGEQFTFTWNLTDVGGIDLTVFYIGGINGWVIDWCGFGTLGTRISGDEFDGTYSATCDIPATAVNGTYTVFIHATDVFGQFTTQSFDFVVGGGIADAAAPEISNVQVLRDSDSDRTFTVTYRITDESGVDSTYSSWIYIMGFGFVDANGNLYATFDPEDQLTPPARISGDEFDGVYSQNMKFTEFAGPGTYQVWIGTRDIYGNRSFATYITIELS